MCCWRRLRTPLQRRPSVALPLVAASAPSSVALSLSGHGAGAVLVAPIAFGCGGAPARVVLDTGSSAAWVKAELWGGGDGVTGDNCAPRRLGANLRHAAAPAASTFSMEYGSGGVAGVVRRGAVRIGGHPALPRLSVGLAAAGGALLLRHGRKFDGVLGLARPGAGARELTAPLSALGPAATFAFAIDSSGGSSGGGAAAGSFILGAPTRPLTAGDLPSGGAMARIPLVQPTAYWAIRVDAGDGGVGTPVDGELPGEEPLCTRVAARRHARRGGGCVAIVDSGTSFLGMPQADYDRVTARIVATSEGRCALVGGGGAGPGGSPGGGGAAPRQLRCTPCDAAGPPGHCLGGLPTLVVATTDAAGARVALRVPPAAYLTAPLAEGVGAGLWARARCALTRWAAGAAGARPRGWWGALTGGVLADAAGAEGCGGAASPPTLTAALGVVYPQRLLGGGRVQLVLGLPLMRAYDTLFDVGSRVVGLAPVAAARRPPGWPASPA